MLNSHAEILIGREFPLEKLPSLRPLLAETAAYQGEGWTEQRRAEVIRALWLSLSRRVGPGNSDARRWGMKTPWAEFDRDLWDPLVEPLYLYVLRRGDRVFRSHIELGWNSAGTPAQLLARYKDSLRAGEAMRAEGVAHIVQLDLALDPESRRSLARDLFDFLGERVDAGVERFVEEWPRHPWTHPTSDDGPVELPQEWQRLLADDSEYKELMAKHGY